MRLYSCRASVYEIFNLGHGRYYMFLDIAHLVLQYYFRYDVVHCTNVSDIDDKVIKWARQAYLLRSCRIRFFNDIKKYSVTTTKSDYINTGTTFSQYDFPLFEHLATTKKQIHFVLCDPIDTPVVMESINQLISTTHEYLNINGGNVNNQLISFINTYVRGMLQTLSLDIDDY